MTMTTTTATTTTKAITQTKAIKFVTRPRTAVFVFANYSSLFWDWCDFHGDPTIPLYDVSFNAFPL